MAIEYTCSMLACKRALFLKAKRKECCLSAVIFMCWHIVLDAGEDINVLYKDLSF
jgi:hypothetical protein